MAYVPYDQYGIPTVESDRIKEQWRKLQFQFEGRERGGLPLHPNDIKMPDEAISEYKQLSYVRQGYDIPDTPRPFYIENVDTVTGSISFERMLGKNIEYSFDETNWTTLSIPSTEAVYISNVAPRTKVYLRGTNSTVGTSITNKHISANFNHNLGGNICSLLDKTNFSTMTSITSNYAFGSLFKYDTNLISADFKLGNVTSLGDYVFYQTFSGCTSLTIGPDLSNITSLGSSALYAAFMDCTSLTTEPDLSSVTSVGDDALYNVFSSCSSLTTAPDLSNITSLGSSALRNALAYCSKIQTVYVPNVSSWNTSAFYNWVNGAGSSAATPKQMIFQTQALLDACPEGTSGYGNYTKVLAS